ncbi:hypothetical protein ASD32_23760 [Rhizobium sp. Root483D2]|nr:hypothetical protein ASD32_23760 [Rhizobium sp. Root483D2]
MRGRFAPNSRKDPLIASRQLGTSPRWGEGGDRGGARIPQSIVGNPTARADRRAICKIGNAMSTGALGVLALLPSGEKVAHSAG